MRASLLGAVCTATADIAPAWGARFIRYGVFAQDEWHATPKLTVSYGLRWDYDPPFSEVQNKISSFQPDLPNPGAGGRLGALAFIGSGQAASAAISRMAGRKVSDRDWDWPIKPTAKL